MQIKKGALVGVTLCLGTALAMAVSDYDDTTTGVVASSKKWYSTSSLGQGEQAQPDMRFELSAIKRSAPNNIRGSDLFQSRNWHAPPPLPPVTPSANLSPPQPSVPSLPFTFIGRMLDGNDVILFLSKNDRHYTVKVNDLLDDTYRVDKITDSSAVLTYLPMNTQQTLAFNATTLGSSALSAMASPPSIVTPTH